MATVDLNRVKSTWAWLQVHGSDQHGPDRSDPLDRPVHLLPSLPSLVRLQLGFRGDGSTYLVEAIPTAVRETSSETRSKAASSSCSDDQRLVVLPNNDDEV